MTTPQAMIFDLDGTLADTLATIANAVNFALGSMDLPPHPLDDYRTMVGDGVVVLCQRALPAGHEASLDELLQRVRRRYDTHVMDGVRMYDGMEDLLAELTRRGIRMAVLSNKPDELTLSTIRGLGIESHFDCILGQRDEIPRKPDPAGVEWIRQRIPLAPEHFLYVGDTPTDMKTAQAAGMPSVGATWGFRSAEELRQSGADHLVDRPMEILGLVERLAGEPHQ